MHLTMGCSPRKLMPKQMCRSVGSHWILFCLSAYMDQYVRAAYKCCWFCQPCLPPFYTFYGTYSIFKRIKKTWHESCDTYNEGWTVRAAVEHKMCAPPSLISTLSFSAAAWHGMISVPEPWTCLLIAADACRLISSTFHSSSHHSFPMRLQPRHIHFLYSSVSV